MLPLTDTALLGINVPMSMEFADKLFQFGAIILVGMMGLWTYALWKNYSLTKRVLFQAIPFLLVIALFSLAFYSERIH